MEPGWPLTSSFSAWARPQENALTLSQMLETELDGSQLQGWHPDAPSRFQNSSSHSSQRFPTTPVLQGHCPVSLLQKQGLSRGHRVALVPRRSQEHSGKHQCTYTSKHVTLLWPYGPVVTMWHIPHWPLYLYSCVAGRCHSNQACRTGTVDPLCSEGSGDILRLCRRRHRCRLGQCCCCRSTPCRWHLATSGRRRNPNCTCHIVHLRGRRSEDRSGEL